MSKHTEGPWIIGFATGKIFGGQPIDGARHEVIATMRPTCVNDRWEADARLIAAAPDLLAGLQKIALSPHDHLESGCTDMCARCIAEFAISKATGEAK